MNILITGADGMLGSCLVKEFRNFANIFATSRSKELPYIHEHHLSFDLTSNCLEPLFLWSKPNVVIHTAAMTNVDMCELNPRSAYSINTESVSKLIDLSSKYNSKIIFISSDAVFGGFITAPSELSAPSPLNIYGSSKLSSEFLLFNSTVPHVIIRTTIIGKSIKSTNTSFAQWIYESLKRSNPIHLYEDVIFSPISIWDLSNEIQHIITTNMTGLFHVSGSSSVTKYEFGINFAKYLNLDLKLINKSTFKAGNHKASRSLNQTLDSSFYEKVSGRKLPTSIESIEVVSRFFDI